jgi:AraC-like DNA-binding protein
MKPERRHPRPLGTTDLAIKYHKSQNNKDLILLYKHIIKNYVKTSFRLNGISASMEELANYLGLSPARLQVLFLAVTGEMANVFSDKGEVEKALRAVTFSSLEGALADRGRILQHLDMLMFDQQSRYTPFLTAEVGKTLKLLLESHKPVAEIIKMFSALPATTQINILNAQGPTENTNNYLTVTKAVEALNENQTSLQQSPLDMQAIAAEYDLSHSPEVRATHQHSNVNESAGSGRVEGTVIKVSGS